MFKMKCEAHPAEEQLAEVANRPGATAEEKSTVAQARALGFSWPTIIQVIFSSQGYAFLQALIAAFLAGQQNPAPVQSAEPAPPVA